MLVLGLEIKHQGGWAATKVDLDWVDAFEFLLDDLLRVMGLNKAVGDYVELVVLAAFFVVINVYFIIGNTNLGLSEITMFSFDQAVFRNTISLTVYLKQKVVLDLDKVFH